MKTPEHVLIVDDNQAMRATLNWAVKHILPTATIACATDSVEACLAAAQNIGQGRRFELIITDLEMPGATGVELIRSLLATHPGTRFILCSGSMDQQGGAALVAKEFHKPMDIHYMTKPFDLESLKNLCCLR